MGFFELVTATGRSILVVVNRNASIRWISSKPQSSLQRENNWGLNRLRFVFKFSSFIFFFFHQELATPSRFQIKRLQLYFQRYDNKPVIVSLFSSNKLPCVFQKLPTDSNSTTVIASDLNINGKNKQLRNVREKNFIYTPYLRSSYLRPLTKTDKTSNLRRTAKLTRRYVT